MKSTCQAGDNNRDSSTSQSDTSNRKINRTASLSLSLLGIMALVAGIVQLVALPTEFRAPKLYADFVAPVVPIVMCKVAMRLPSQSQPPLFETVVWNVVLQNTGKLIEYTYEEGKDGACHMYVKETPPLNLPTRDARFGYAVPDYELLKGHKIKAEYSIRFSDVNNVSSGYVYINDGVSAQGQGFAAFPPDTPGIMTQTFHVSENAKTLEFWVRILPGKISGPATVSLVSVRKVLESYESYVIQGSYRRMEGKANVDIRKPRFL
jgi:hypothetical protein